MEEQWAPAHRYEDRYEVSDLGRCRRSKPPFRVPFLTLSVSTGKYGSYWLALTGKDQQKVLAHRLIWESFNRPIPDKMQINHINGVKTDNRLINLEAVTVKANAWHRHHVLMVPFSSPPVSEKRAKGMAALTAGNFAEFERLRALGWSQKLIAEEFELNQSTISRALRGLISPITNPVCSP